MCNAGWLEDPDSGYNETANLADEATCIVELIFVVVDPILDGESPFKNLYPPGENPFEDWIFPSNATGLPPAPQWVWEKLGMSAPAKAPDSVHIQAALDPTGAAGS